MAARFSPSLSDAIYPRVSECKSPAAAGS